MSPVTHLMLGWTVGTAIPLARRDRAMVTLAGVAPDLDGLGAVLGYLTLSQDRAQRWFGEYHHILGHNLLFGLVLAAVCAIVAKSRPATALLVLVSFHLHLLGDVVGGQGPDGYPWPIPYLLPFSAAWQWSWGGQWKLNAWPNLVITLLLLGWVFRLAWRQGISPLEIVSSRVNRVFVEALRARFGQPANAGSSHAMRNGTD